jgi:peroxiredoxin
MTTRLDWVLLGLLLVSVFLNVLLSLKVREFRRQMSEMETLQPGARIEALALSESSDGPAQVRFQGAPRPTILYVFSPQCRWCEKNTRDIQALYESLKGRYDFYAVALSTGGLESFLAKSPLRFPVLRNLPTDEVRKLKSGATPQTVAIATDGTVEKSWVGAYDRVTCAEIEKALKVPSGTLSAVQQP